jgi:hypothetical protein
MARERAKLTDKEERILIQAQLMGLSTGSMVKIGNRLRALEKERKDIAAINDVCQDYSWIEIKGGWAINTPDKYVVEFTNQTRSKNKPWYQIDWDFAVKLYKPGTRFKPRYFKKKTISVSTEWKAKLCPANSKIVYALIRYCYRIKKDIHKMQMGAV